MTTSCEATAIRVQTSKSSEVLFNACARSRTFSAAVVLVDRRPGPTLGLFLRNATLLISFGDMVGFAFLFVGIGRAWVSLLGSSANGQTPNGFCVSGRRLNGMRIETILNERRGFDSQSRAGAYREAGWSSFDPAAQPWTPEQIEQERARYR